jgi:hypothetical protein
MTPIEDPAPSLSTEAAGAAEPTDDLEHWLSDLRTDVAANPSDWIDADPGADHPTGAPVNRFADLPTGDPVDRFRDHPTGDAVSPEPLPHDQPETGAAEPRSVGRHRAPE